MNADSAELADQADQTQQQLAVRVLLENHKSTSQRRLRGIRKFRLVRVQRRLFIIPVERREESRGFGCLGEALEADELSAPDAFEVEREWSESGSGGTVEQLRTRLKLLRYCAEYDANLAAIS